MGAQCQRQPVSGGSGLCIQHCQQARSKSGLTHGRVDGPIPAAKLAEFERGAAAGSPGAPVRNAAAVAAGASPSTLQGCGTESSVAAAMAAAKMVREMRLEIPPTSSPVSDAAADEEQFRAPSRSPHDVPSHWLTFSAVDDGVLPSEPRRAEERTDSKAVTASLPRAAPRAPRADSPARAPVPRRLVGKSKAPALPSAATPLAPQRKSAQRKAPAPKQSAPGDDADWEERLMGNAAVAGVAAFNGEEPACSKGGSPRLKRSRVGG